MSSRQLWVYLAANVDALITIAEILYETHSISTWEDESQHVL